MYSIWQKLVSLPDGDRTMVTMEPPFKRPYSSDSIEVKLFMIQCAVIAINNLEGDMLKCRSQLGSLRVRFRNRFFPIYYMIDSEAKG